MYKEMIAEMAEKMGVKITGLEEIPKIVQGRPLFDLVGVDNNDLKKYSQNDNDLYMANGKMNIALHPDGRVEPLRMVSEQYKVVQHDHAIHELFQSVTKQGINIKTIDIKLTPNGGRSVTKFTTDIEMEVAKGDKISYQFLLGNSGDSTSNLWTQGGSWRFFCENGMIIPDNRIERVKQRKLHKGTLSLEGEVAKFCSIAEESIKTMGAWKAYTKKILRAPDLDTVFEQLQVGPRVQEEILELELRGEGHTINDLLTGNGVRVWDMYNAFTQRITDSESQEFVKREQGDKVAKYFDSLVLG